MPNKNINWNQRKYGHIEFVEAWKSSSNLSEVCRKLNLSTRGGNPMTMRLTAQKLGLSSTHFVEYKNRAVGKRKSLDEILTYGKRIAGYDLLPRLVKNGYFERRCYICLREKWNGKEIPLELDHIDGDSLNNVIENLRPLCPNCHAQTPTWRGRNARKEKSLLSCACGNGCTKSNRNCTEGQKKRRTKITWPDSIILEQMVADMGYRKAGKLLGVSDNAIRKHLKKSDC